MGADGHYFSDDLILSVIVPVYNESENVPGLIDELSSALDNAGYGYEIIFVDDSSEDGTAQAVEDRAAGNSRIHLLGHRANFGQSAALATGFRAACGVWLATLDGDGQNDPADLPRLLARAREEGADCVTGIRLKRRDTWFKRLSSRIANCFRNVITGDSIVDSGCGVRVFRRDAILELPVFNGMHRFVPTLLRAQGFKVIEEPVGHRPRKYGISKYGMHNRLWRGIRDCFGVRWYRRRALPAARIGAGADCDPDNTSASDPGGGAVEEIGRGLSGESRRLLILLTGALIVLLLHHFGPLQDPLKEVRALMGSLDGGGAAAKPVFFAVTLLMVALGVPRLIFFALGGFFFGFWQGLLLALSGTTGGAFATFLFIRWCGREWVRKRFGGRAFFRNMLDGSLTARSVFFVRQLPFSCIFINIGLALSAVGPRAFLAGSLLGFLPQGIIAALIGSGLSEAGYMGGVAELTAAALFVFAVMFFSWQWQKRRRAVSGK